jgi:AsmA protein
VLAESLNRLPRSLASAPLLDAVQDRKTRDAVRSVLERFTGGGTKAAAPGAPAAVAAEAKPN